MMKNEEIIEMAIQGHASTRDAIRWAMNQEREAWERKFARLQSLMDLRETQPNKPCCLAEREACANLCEQHGYDHYCGNVTDKLAETIRARGQA
jgi:hypothetical protein